MRRLLLSLAAAILPLAASGLPADHRASYEKGIKAIDQGEWHEAFDALHEAIAQRAVEGEKVLIYGMRYKPYLPYYYLGVAYLRTGNCRAAVRAWDESERQGAIRTAPEYRTLQESRQMCLAQQSADTERALASGSGLLIIDALPWARVESVESASGQNWLSSSETYTPLALALPPGEYTVVLTSAAFPGKRVRLSAQVHPGRSAHCMGRFEPVNPKDYFKNRGWKP